MKVSVIIPYSPKHTPKHLLRSTLRSVERQSVETNIIVITDSEGRGPAWARNRGLERASTRFVALLDADDMWKPQKLKKQIQAIQNTGYCMCVEEKQISRKKFIDELILDNIEPLMSSALVDRRVGDLRFDECLQHKEDHLYMIRNAIQGGVCFRKDLVTVRRHDTSFTNSKTYNQNFVKDYLLFYKKVRDEYNVSESVKLEFFKNMYYDKARHKYYQKKYNQAEQYAIKSILVYPKVKSIVTWFQSVLLRLIS